MVCCVAKKSICTNASILVIVTFKDDLSIFEDASVEDADGGVSIEVSARAVMALIVGVG